MVLLIAPIGGSVAGAATTTAPCWERVLNEWYSGAHETIVPLRCYREAAVHLSASELPAFDRSISEVVSGPGATVKRGVVPRTSVMPSVLPCVIPKGARSCNGLGERPSKLASGSRVGAIAPGPNTRTSTWVWGLAGGGVLLAGAGLAWALRRRAHKT
jgi:hypothetical protein